MDDACCAANAARCALLTAHPSCALSRLTPASSPPLFPSSPLPLLPSSGRGRAPLGRYLSLVRLKAKEARHYGLWEEPFAAEARAASESGERASSGTWTWAVLHIAKKARHGMMREAERRLMAAEERASAAFEAAVAWHAQERAMFEAATQGWTPFFQ